jgi:hypothetical protein
MFPPIPAGDSSTGGGGGPVLDPQRLSSDFVQSVKWWGAKASNDIADADINTAAFQAAIAAILINGAGGEVLAPGGIYYVKDLYAAGTPGIKMRGARPGIAADGTYSGTGTVIKYGGAVAAPDKDIAAVNATTNVVTVGNHGYATGDGPFRWKTVLGGRGAMPGGVVRDRDYWAIYVDANNFKLATSHANALALTAVDITSVGTANDGYHKIYAGEEAILHIRNSNCGTIEDIAFEGENAAKYLIHGKHVAGDDRDIRMWRFPGCTFGNASIYNVFEEGSDPSNGYGDGSAWNFDGVTWLGSHGAATFAHYRNTTQYSFGVDFKTCLGGGSSASPGWPSYWISMQSGTANVRGGVNGSCGFAAYHFDGAPGIDPPAMTVDGCEAQSGAKLLVTETEGSGCNLPIRSTVFTGFLGDDINTPYETTQIDWDLAGEGGALLGLYGVNILGDVNIAVPTAVVDCRGATLRAPASGVPQGDLLISTFIGYPDRAFGTWREAVTSLSAGRLRSRDAGGERASGTVDPSVAPGVSTSRPATYNRSTEYEFKTLAKLNEVVAPYGASFAHAWRFQEASGNAADMALTGGIPLVPSAGVTQHVATGLTDYETDYAVQFGDGTDQYMAPASAASLDVTTGDLVIFGRVHSTALPVADSALVGKAGTHYWLLSFLNDGRLFFAASDGTHAPSVSLPVDHHHATAYYDFLAVIDRTSVTKLLALCSTLSAGGTSDASLLATITATGKFAVGAQPANITTGPFKVPFVAIGSVAGTLVADRVAALAALSSAMNSPAQLWIKTADADTAWTKAY